MKKRLVILIAYFFITNLLAFLMLGNGHGTKAFFIGFYSWTFVFIGSYLKSIPAMVLAYAAYLICQFVLVTVLTRRKIGQGPFVPVMIHCMGIVFFVLNRTPLNTDEGPGSFMAFLIPAISIAIIYILKDWAKAQAAIGHRTP